MEMSLRRLSLTATLHCLTGCAIGEILGMIIGAYFGIHDAAAIGLSVVLAFIFGYSFTVIPLLKHMHFKKAVSTALASDTVSIAVMEITDNIIIIIIPGALAAGLTTALFWGSLTISLIVAFIVAFPVNYYLIKRGKGHAVVHSHHQHGT